MPLGSVPLVQLAADLASGATTSRALIETAIAAAQDRNGEGGWVFVRLDTARARAEAEASDRLRAAGVVPSPLAGLPVSIKDLFDVAGEVTTAASPTLADTPPRPCGIRPRWRVSGRPAGSRSAAPT